ncbi:MAG: 50S ribosomal protein L5 [Candidatus Nanohaloarchaea archaeon]
MTQEMRQIKVAKVTINASAGEVGDEAEKAYDLLEQLTGKEPVRTESKPDSKTFGLREGLNIGAKVTLRDKEAREFLERVAPAIDNQVSEKAFDGQGNFSFGISEYIDIPEMEYNSEIGMRGLEIAVTLERPGARIKKRDHKPSEIGDKQRVSDEEAKTFVEEELGLEVTE